MIFFENVSKLYRSAKDSNPDSQDSSHHSAAVNNLSLKLEPGKTHVFIGPSGCGKSTLLRLIAGLEAPTSGTVKVKGQIPTHIPPKVYARNIGYVIQEGGLFPHLSVYENLSIGPFGTQLTRTEQSERINARIEELLQLVHLEKLFLKRFPHQLSGGQRQRVALARALMHDPGYLLLDEPLGALDPVVRSDLQQSLKEIFQSLKKTVVLVTHDLMEAATLGNTLYLMNKGSVVQSGTFKDIHLNPHDDFVRTFITAQKPSQEFLDLWN